MTGDTATSAIRQGDTPAGSSPAGRIVTVLAFATLLMVAFQFALAAYGSFGADYTAHASLGRAIPTSAALLLVATLVARSGVRYITIAALLLLLAGPAAFLMAGLAWDAGPWLGALHGLNGVLVAVLGGMMTRAGRPAAR